MNKKAFASATAIAVVAGAVAGAVYYRHQVVKALDELLQPHRGRGRSVPGGPEAAVPVWLDRP